MDPCAVPADPLPSIPGLPFSYPGASILIVGPTGGGRSALAEACLYDAARAGIRGAYFGHEITAAEFDARAADIAARRGDTVDDALRAELERARYLDLAGVMTAAWAEPDAWAKGVIACFDVVVIDPLSAVASTLDLDFDNSNSEYIRWHDKIVQPVTRGGVTVVQIDNIGHALEAKNRAKGVSAKADRSDLTFSCSASANPVGLVIRAGKIRTVRAGFQRGDEWLFARDTQRIDKRTGSTPETDAVWQPTEAMTHISRLVDEQPGISTRAIRDQTPFKAATVDTALRTLIELDHIEQRPDGPAHRHYPCPDRVPTSDTDRVPPCPSVAPTCPDRVPAPKPDRVPVSHPP